MPLSETKMASFPGKRERDFGQKKKKKKKRETITNKI